MLSQRSDEGILLALTEKEQIFPHIGTVSPIGNSIALQSVHIPPFFRQIQPAQISKAGTKDQLHRRFRIAHMVYHILQDLFLHLGRNPLHHKTAFRRPVGWAPLIPQGGIKAGQFFRRNEQLLRKRVIATPAAVRIHQQALPAVHSVHRRVGIVGHAGEIELHPAVIPDAEPGHRPISGSQSHLRTRQFPVQVLLRSPAEGILRGSRQFQGLRQGDHPILLPVVDQGVDITVVAGAGRVQIEDQVIVPFGHRRIKQAPLAPYRIHGGIHNGLILAFEGGQGLVDLLGTLSFRRQSGDLNIVAQGIIILGVHCETSGLRSTSAGHQPSAQADGQGHHPYQKQGRPLVPGKEITQALLGLFGRPAHAGRQPGMGHVHNGPPLS